MGDGTPAPWPVYLDGTLMDALVRTVRLPDLVVDVRVEQEIEPDGRTGRAVGDLAESAVARVLTAAAAAARDLYDDFEEWTAMGSGARITALGHYQPSTELTNDRLATMVDTNDEWIRRRVGIRSRRVAAPGETVDQMATEAARKALAASGLTTDVIDLVVVATCTAVERSPNTAARVSHDLGLTSPAVLDVNVVCAGFNHALAVAHHAIAAGSAANALVIGADQFTSVVDWTDRSTAILVGDGAAAAVVTASERDEIGPVVWGSFPDMHRAVRIEGTPSRFSQDGQAVYRWATTELPPIALRACAAAGVAVEDLAAVVLHQANARIIESFVKRLGPTTAVVALDVEESGNTSAASVPLAFSKLVEQRAVQAGDPVLLFGFGGNLSYAGQVVLSP